MIVEERVACDKLQSHKSSFQAWKCVSFGCSLLSIVLLLSKWYEVNTDLHLLVGIDRILSLQNAQLSGELSANNTASGSGVPLSWPPVPIDLLLPPNNETDLGLATIESNQTMLMSHMHITLSRELAGNQLLLQEVNAFIAEFKNSRATLSLSSLLLLVYIISWVLMTLAINDTRISNDISLRNILLLSIFGAIDIAASVGFVMVRLIMYSVKNSSFTGQMLSASGLRDTPVRLTADQLTAFTALRMIAMRSCSAYIDAYISTLIALLTILRLYAILRALSFYRHMRRVNDRQGLLDLTEQQNHNQQPQLPHPTVDTKQLVWSTPTPQPSFDMLLNGRPMSMGPLSQFEPRLESYRSHTTQTRGRASNRPSSTSYQRRQVRSPELINLSSAKTATTTTGRRKVDRYRRRSELPLDEPRSNLQPQQSVESVQPEASRIVRNSSQVGAHHDEKPELLVVKMKDLQISTKPEQVAKLASVDLDQVLDCLQTTGEVKGDCSQQAVGSTYTLVGSTSTGSRKGSRSATMGKYRLVARYRPVLEEADAVQVREISGNQKSRHSAKLLSRLLVEDLHLADQRRRHSLATNSAATPLSSTSSDRSDLDSVEEAGSSCEPDLDSDDNLTARMAITKAAESEIEISPVSAVYRTEEFVGAQQVFELGQTSSKQSSSKGNMLLGKYYYA